MPILSHRNTPQQPSGPLYALLLLPRLLNTIKVTIPPARNNVASIARPVYTNGSSQLGKLLGCETGRVPLPDGATLYGSDARHCSSSWSVVTPSPAMSASSYVTPFLNSATVVANLSGP